ncbi:MAG: ATP-binding protein, partial [Sutterella sp.]
GIGLTPRQKLQVIFIIQEALSNVRKHAQAQSVLITIDNREDLRVNILDDGVGLDEEVVETRKGQHVGLSIMSERAKRIGASLSVSRAGPEGGTLVSLFLGKDARH